MEDRLADEKKKIAEYVKRATEKQFEKEKLHFENELEESKVNNAHKLMRNVLKKELNFFSYHNSILIY